MFGCGFVFILFRISCIYKLKSWIYRFRLFVKFGKYLSIVSSNKFSAPLLHLSCWNFNDMNLRPLSLSHKSLSFSSVFFLNTPPNDNFYLLFSCLFFLCHFFCCWSYTGFLCFHLLYFLVLSCSFDPLPLLFLCWDLLSFYSRMSVLTCWNIFRIAVLVFVSTMSVFLALASFDCLFPSQLIFLFFSNAKQPFYCILDCLDIIIRFYLGHLKILWRILIFFF